MVDCIGLENRRTERYRGFESLSLRTERQPFRLPFLVQERSSNPRLPPFPHALIPRQLRLGQPALLSRSAEKSSSNEQSASEASSNEAPQRGSKQYPYVAVGVTAPLIGLGWPKGNPLKALFAKGIALGEEDGEILALTRQKHKPGFV